jgi:hypothetical protein
MSDDLIARLLEIIELNDRFGTRALELAIEVRRESPDASVDEGCWQFLHSTDAVAALILAALAAERQAREQAEQALAFQRKRAERFIEQYGTQKERAEQAEQERDEAIRKQQIDQRQCDEMTSTAGELTADLAAAEQERDRLRNRLRTFAREVLDGYRTGVVGDIDGGWLEDKALELGLLVASDSENEDAIYRLAAALAPQDGQP